MNGFARLLGMLALGIFLFVAADAVIFGSGLYARALDPASSTGSFESSIVRVRALPPSRTDVLVIGDSRIYSGLDPTIASHASSGLRFLNAAVPGTTPRCWYYYLRAVDPRADRFGAIVIPVDTYADDDSAIGSEDGNDREMDLRYIAFRAQLHDLPAIVGSFDNFAQRSNAALNLTLRGPQIGGDVRDLLADPLMRAPQIAKSRVDSTYDPLAAHPKHHSLADLHVDALHQVIDDPPEIDAAEIQALRTQIFHEPQPDPGYGAYRRMWIGPIVERYRQAGVPVIFVRIPTRPVRVYPAERPSGTLVRLARAYGAWLLPPHAYLALEKPSYFADHDHLDAAGSRVFSALLGSDVAVALRRHAGMPLPSVLATVPGRLAPAPRATAPARAPVFGNIVLRLRFQSIAFWLFFALVTLLFYAAPRRLKWGVLLLASYAFYASWNTWYIVFLLALTLSDYAFGIALDHTRTRRRLYLTLGVAANLLFLGTLKYANFATGTISALLGMHQDPWLVQLIVPIGISFHTFQSISYLVDVYRKKMPAIRSLFEYALYLAFFPQLLAGPIVRAETFFREFRGWRAATAEDVNYGIMRILFGLVKKMAVADQFAPISDKYFSAIAAYPGSVDAWIGVFAFTMQIYFDFSGYSDIAIGCARILGFVFPENFDTPYLATSITEFWHRWHMSLSTWLRDYLYIPLGGNRGTTLFTLRNLMLTMLLGGLWHGANWTFVAWGGVHGALLSVERLLGIGRGERAHPGGVAAWPRALLTFVLVMLAWVLFRARSFHDALAVYHSLFAFRPGAALLPDVPFAITLAVVATGVVLFANRQKHVVLFWDRLALPVQSAAVAGLLFFFQFFWYQPVTTQFVYFKF